MRHFLIATHGELSKAFIETFELIAGKTTNVSYFAMTKLKSGDLAKEELKTILSTKNKDEHFIVLTDVFGGSVTNICTELLMDFKDFDIITGLNLPMMLTLILSGDELSIEDMIEEGVRSAKEGIIHINKLLEAQKGTKEDDLIITD
jgi:mannose/fructose/sorbose-specific phosphotransferase system IIA component